MKKHNLQIGQIVGGLEIISLSGSTGYEYNGKKQAQTKIWLCKCIHCKKEIEVRQSNVINNKDGCKTCSARINGLKERKYLFPSLFWNRIKFRAKNKGRVLEVDDVFLLELFLKQGGRCAISGIELILPKLNKEMKECTASLDRIDSNLGYTKNNVQWIHKEINAMKLAISDEQLIEWCHKISKFQRKKVK